MSFHRTPKPCALFTPYEHGGVIHFSSTLPQLSDQLFFVDLLGLGCLTLELFVCLKAITSIAALFD